MEKTDKKNFTRTFNKIRYYRLLKARNIKSFDSEMNEERYFKNFKLHTNKNMYYDHHEFMKALNVKDIDTDLSIDRFKEYIENYPLDFSASAYYISVLIKNKRLDEADIALAKLEENLMENNYENFLPEQVDKIKSAIVYSKLKLLMYKEKYMEAFAYIFNNSYMLNCDRDYLEAIMLYIRKKVGNIHTHYQLCPDEYMINQILDYSHERLLEHVNRNVAVEDVNIDANIPVFSNEFPLDEVIEYVRSNTPNDHAIYNGIFEDTYIYKYDLCGKIGKKNVDYFKVLTFHDTNQILTIHPCIEGDYLDYTDINYLNRNSNVGHVESGLERFNKRYVKTLDK